MLQILLHEMAHASNQRSSGPLWRAEMHWLQALGAPVEEPTSYKERIPLTRQLVFDAGYDAFFSQPERAASEMSPDGYSMSMAFHLGIRSCRPTLGVMRAARGPSRGDRA